MENSQETLKRSLKKHKLIFCVSKIPEHWLAEVNKQAKERFLFLLLQQVGKAAEKKTIWLEKERRIKQRLRLSSWTGEETFEVKYKCSLHIQYIACTFLLGAFFFWCNTEIPLELKIPIKCPNMTLKMYFKIHSLFSPSNWLIFTVYELFFLLFVLIPFRLVLLDVWWFHSVTKVSSYCELNKHYVLSQNLLVLPSCQSSCFWVLNEKRLTGRTVLYGTAGVASLWLLIKS